MSVVYKREMVGLNKDESLKVWSVEVRDYLCPVDNVGKVALAIRHGKKGGKIQEDLEFFTEGKQGRDAVQQAIFEAQSRVKKQFDSNYRETEEELKNLPILAMLAHDASGALEKVKIEDGVFTSDKFDGLRCLAKCEALGVVKLYSRKNQLMDVPHIEKELAWIMNPGEILDGELYVHGEVLQDINSAAKRTDPDKEIKKAQRSLDKVNKLEGDPKISDDQWHAMNIKAENDLRDALLIKDIRSRLEFHVFDLVQVNIKFAERLKRLQEYARERFKYKYVHVVKYNVAYDYPTLRDLHKDAVDRGFEGLMIRTRDGLYESGKRSRGIWKYKEFMDAEFYILDIIEDKKDGSIFWLANNMIGTDYEVHRFGCVMGTVEERIARLENKGQFIGKYLNVQFQSRFKRTMLPQFPSGKYIREGEYVGGEFVPTH